MGRKGTQQRPYGTPTSRLNTSVLPSTMEWLQDFAERNATTLGKILDSIAIAARTNQQKPAHAWGSPPLGRIASRYGRQTESTQWEQWSREKALVRYFRPILRRLLHLACPAAYRSEKAMQETFGYRAPRKRRYSKHDGDDRSGRVLVMA